MVVGSTYMTQIVSEIVSESYWSLLKNCVYCKKEKKNEYIHIPHNFDTITSYILPRDVFIL